MVDADELRRLYREAFLCGLTKLQRQSKLKLTGEFAALLKPEPWRQFTDKLQQTDWVSYIQAPPQPNQSAEHVLKYLARYLSGGPISDQRIISTDGDSVTFLARAGEESGGNSKQVPLTISQIEFTRRWSLHVLPSGYIRTRRYGGWSNSRRKKYVSTMTSELGTTQSPDWVVPEPQSADGGRVDSGRIDWR